MYFTAVTVLIPTVLTQYPVAQKLLFPNLYFKFACRSNIIMALFPLRYPVICDTLYLGGMLTSKWMWSGIMCPSMISIPFHLHKAFMIPCISFRSSLYIIFLLYFGVKTM